MSSALHPAPLSLQRLLRHLPALRRLCKQWDIDLCYLFGSLARDRMGPMSDIDIAVLAPTVDFRSSLRLQSALAALLTPHDVDLVLLHQATPLLCMNVVAHGRVLYQRTARLLTAFRYRAMQRYQSTEHLRNNAQRQVEAEFL